MPEGFPDNAAEQTPNLFPLVSPEVIELIRQSGQFEGDYFPREHRMAELITQGAKPRLLTATEGETVRIGFDQLPPDQDTISHPMLEPLIENNLELIAQGLVGANSDRYGRALAAPSLPRRPPVAGRFLKDFEGGQLLNPRIALLSAEGHNYEQYTTTSRSFMPEDPLRDTRIALVTVDKQTTGKPPAAQTFRVVLSVGEQMRNGDRKVHIHVPRSQPKSPYDEQRRLGQVTAHIIEASERLGPIGGSDGSY